MPKLWLRGVFPSQQSWYALNYPFDDNESRQMIEQLRYYCHLHYGKEYTHEEVIPLLKTLIDHGVS